jgi:hypothetical protein
MFHGALGLRFDLLKCKQLVGAKPRSKARALLTCVGRDALHNVIGITPNPPVIKYIYKVVKCYNITKD